ncbi:hypothetical protein DPEC_G00285350 [Dallia pectoralis]|uniref:Uncharacterized protein n=1 Tax=Dallia pectoralis TaxID=75939 RepID=A0ACC2FJK6_DALPE|nr:hypothetical protein DPEC_G00285350 [Dallia pectoralis]
MFGRQPMLPVDLILGLKPPTETHTTHSEYVQTLRQRLKESYALAAENSKKSGERNKHRFDAKVKTAELEEGDRVLVKNVNIRGKHKLADKWERPIHIVVKRIDGGPVYVVKPEAGNGPRRTLHRDLLLPCGFLPVDITPDSVPHQSKPTQLRLRSRQNQEVECEYSDREEEDDGYYVNEPPQFTTWGPYVQEFEVIPVSGSESSLNPRAPEFKCPEPQLIHDHSVAPLDTNAAAHQFSTQSDHVVIDIPENEISQSAVVTDPTPAHDSDQAQSSSSLNPKKHSDMTCGEEQGEARRSQRERHPPPKFTYEELGKPLILALKSKENIESLLSPAADIVKPLGTNATPQAYLTQLESAFGVVEDGEELFATFLGSNQNSGEKPSVYLSRLQTLLTKAVTRGGVSAAESDKYLLRQFCRGCWDQSLIIGLQLEHRRPNPHISRIVVAFENGGG